MQKLDTHPVLESAAIPDDSLVDIGAAHRESNLEQVLDDLDRELVGLRPVKSYIRQIASLLLVARLREKIGLATDRPTLHMCFTGHPGTGKTTVAMRMATLLHNLGYVRRGHLVVATRDDLVGQYVGHTAPKTKEILKKAMGGVLFIDEAYYLYRPENERDYGQEAIEMLLQVMENQREDLVVILAGYQARMETFFQYNPGFRSRIAHHISFPDYAMEELATIGGIDVEPAELYLRRRVARRRLSSIWSCGASSRTSPTRAAYATPSIASSCGRPIASSPVGAAFPAKSWFASTSWTSGKAVSFTEA